jgi:hypothetical protein
MTTRDFIIMEEDFHKKKKTIIQHKIRTMLKCYTVQDFNLSEESQTFTFRQTFRVNGVQVAMKKVIEGKYEFSHFIDESVNLSKTKLTLIV